MVDFRKLVLTLIAGALLFTAVASAQPYSCNATAVPTLARSEGHAERMGDVLLTCSGTVPAAGILANIRLRLTANITSNPLNTSRTALEASLIKNEDITPGVWNGYGTGAIQNVWQASRISDDEIEWAGVVLAAAGSSGAQTIRLTNVRGDVESRGSFATIYASINIVSPTSVPVDNNLLVVADTRPGMTFAIRKPGATATGSVSLKNCVSPSDTNDVQLEFKEGYASAFLPRGIAATDNTVPGGGYLNESGWNPGTLAGGTLTGLSSIGQTTQGTRLMARLKNIPTDVTVKAPRTVSSTTTGGLSACIVTDTDSNGAGGTVSCTGDPVSVGTSGLLVYEIQGPLSTISYSTQETVVVPLDISFTTPGNIGSVTGNGTLAPISTVHTMNVDAPEPRFIDSGSDTAIFDIAACRTILLFPFVTNQAGFDTGIAIANTSQDPIATVNQSGACSLYFYGNTSGSTGPTSPQTTPSVAAGGHFVMGLSGGGGVYAYNGGFTACASGACVAPLFQGYVIAICNFQFAHGYAFISDFGATKLAQGYLALIIPDYGSKNRVPQNDAVPSTVSSQANAGEGLSN